MDWNLGALYGFLVSLLLHMTVEAGVGCFKCFSINGSDAACGDPFHPAKGDYYVRFCRQTRANRQGEFPARYCTKIKGINSRTRVEMVVRSCDMETFDNTCGTFVFEGDEYHGCLMSCKSNACNGGPSIHRRTSPLLLLPFSSFLLPSLSPASSATSPPSSFLHSNFAVRFRRWFDAQGRTLVGVTLMTLTLNLLLTGCFKVMEVM